MSMSETKPDMRAVVSAAFEMPKALRRGWIQVLASAPHPMRGLQRVKRRKVGA